jgi:tetratricopeptide (TPR) repeat protein
MKAVRKYVELVPDHPNPYDSYGELLQWDGRFEDAATQYRNAVQRDQAFNAAYFGLAEIARLTGRTSDIPGLIEQGIQYAPTTQARINARRALANHYLMQGKRNAAMTELATVAEEAAANDIDWLTTLAHQQLALAAAMSGRGAAVDTHLQAAADVGGADTPAQHAWATWAYAAVGNLDKARTHAQQLEGKADAANWKTASRAANALLQLHENNTAQALYQLEQADPANIVVRALLADCYQRMGRKAEARTLKDEVELLQFHGPHRHGARVEALGCGSWSRSRRSDARGAASTAAGVTRPSLRSAPPAGRRDSRAARSYP